jgi:hypothetical protein
MLAVLRTMLMAPFSNAGSATGERKTKQLKAIGPPLSADMLRQFTRPQDGDYGELDIILQRSLCALERGAANRSALADS